MKRPSSWIDIRGKWEINNDKREISYSGINANLEPHFGVILNDGLLSKGRIKSKVIFPNEVAEGRILFGYSSQTGKYYSAGLGGWEAGYSIQEFLPNFGFRSVKLTGNRVNLKTGKEYQLDVYLSGSQVTLFVDNINILQHVFDEPLQGNQIGLLAYGDKKVIFKEFEFNRLPPEVFVVMQFSEPYNSLYEEVITEVCREFELKVIRGDDCYSEHGIILNEIIKSIVESEIIIAEITPANPNVFYELGFAHALKKPTILLAELGQKLPFDVQGYRTLFYEDSIKGKNAIIENLRKYLKSILVIRDINKL